MKSGNNITAPGAGGSWDSALGLLNAAQHTQIPPIVAGFDGFVDTILHVVSERHSPTEYTRLLTLQEFAHNVLAASGGRNMNKHRDGHASYQDKEVTVRFSPMPWLTSGFRSITSVRLAGPNSIRRLMISQSGKDLLHRRAGLLGCDRVHRMAS
ncbi:MAG TPA: hypothetical protein VIS99_03140 [Terrimicrobiaceae bacterium]